MEPVFASVPQTIAPLASVSNADEQEAMVGILMPPVSAVMPAKVLVDVRAPMFVVWMPPLNVDVAVVVAMMLPTVTADEVASMDVPLNHKSELESADALVPPLAIGRVPVTSVVRSTRDAAMLPAVALRMPLHEPIFSPPVCIWRPFNVEVAVAPSAVVSIPAANVDEAVVVEIWRRSMRAVDEAKSEYVPVVLSCIGVEVAETETP